MASGGIDNHRRVAQNRKARHNYFIEEKVEAGVVLQGTEVKSLRAGRANIAEAHAQVRGGELYLVNAHISPYESGRISNHEPLRPRKLLLHRREIQRLTGKVNREGYTLVPLEMYFNGRGIAKVQLALAKGRKLHDKRDREKAMDWQREKGRLMRAKG